MDSSFDQRYIVPGLSRGLAMLQLFTREKPRQTLQELSAKLGITRSAAYRLAYTLEADGFIVRDERTRRYALTVRATRFAFEYLASTDLLAVALPYLRQLSEVINASAYLAQRDGDQAVYIHRVVPSVRLVSNLQVGTRSPLDRTTSGRVLLAALPDHERETVIAQLCARHGDADHPSFAALGQTAQEDAARGYVYRRSEIDPGITSCAAPIRDMLGSGSAALSVIGPDPVLGAAGGEVGVSRLVAAAARDLSRELGAGERAD